MGLFLLSLSCAPAWGQDTLTVQSSRKTLGIVKFAPLSLLDPHNTLQFGFEYPLKGRWTLQAEAGYGNRYFNLYYYSNDQDDLYNRETWRVRVEGRYYLSRRRAAPWGWYFAPEVLYKRINFIEQGSIGRECEDGVCAYFERTRYKILKDVVGYHVKFGAQYLLGKRITLDFYQGVGFRNIYVKSPSFRENDSNRSDVLFFTLNPESPGRYRLLSMSLGLKVGYLLYQ